MRHLAGLLLSAVVLTGCVSPSRTDADYRAKAANTAEAVASSVSTARLGVRMAAQRRILAPYLSRLLAEAEEDADAAQAAFDAVQPPSGAADTVHEHLTSLVDDALSVLRDLRVAVRRGLLARLPDLARPLDGLADALEEFEGRPR